jgi:hypothetical protein
MKMLAHKYPKISTLWKRNTKGVIIPGDYSLEEFGLINHWHVREKIDGTNIRVLWDGNGGVEFRGRTDKAQIPKPLLEQLEKLFTIELLTKCFEPGSEVILYGEGYGGKIQKVGKKYREIPNFALFDVKVGHWWLTQSAVDDIANKAGIGRAPFIGILTIEQIIRFVKLSNPPKSSLAEKELQIEGIIARPEPLLLLRNGKPLLMKLKLRDYKKYDTFWGITEKT